MPKRRTRRRRKPIDLKRVQVALGEAIEQLEHYILEPAARGDTVDLETLVKVTYALAQAAGSFKSITEASDLEARIAAIEDAAAAAANGGRA